MTGRGIPVDVSAYSVKVSENTLSQQKELFLAAVQVRRINAVKMGFIEYDVSRLCRF